MAGSDSNMEVIILSLTIYTLAHHHQYLTRREGVGEEGEAKMFPTLSFF